MNLKERIQQLSSLPARFSTMLEQALRVVKDDTQREALCVAACVISNASWERWQGNRPPEDNGQEHEWVVFSNIMKIAECEGLNLSDRRIATAFAFTHDSFYIPRIMEAQIRDLEERAAKVKDNDPNLAKELLRRASELRTEKKLQRTKHMEGGAKNAELLLPQLKDPVDSLSPLLQAKEIDDCVALIKGHDTWKTGEPKPPGNARLAVVCLEGDALWPLHPLGILADLLRPNEKGETKDMNDLEEWKKQLRESLKTLLEFRSNWENQAGEKFAGPVSIFRTEEGYRLYLAWREFWNI